MEEKRKGREIRKYPGVNPGWITSYLAVRQRTVQQKLPVSYTEDWVIFNIFALYLISVCDNVKMHLWIARQQIRNKTCHVDTSLVVDIILDFRFQKHAETKRSTFYIVADIILLRYFHLFRLDLENRRNVLNRCRTTNSQGR